MYDYTVNAYYWYSTILSTYSSKSCELTLSAHSLTCDVQHIPTTYLPLFSREEDEGANAFEKPGSVAIK
jgi:hypothetical protein